MTVAPFVLRSGYVELAKVVHSTCGSLTTVFLFTRLWARVQHYHGLWRDDYIRESHYPLTPRPAKAYQNTCTM